MQAVHEQLREKIETHGESKHLEPFEVTVQEMGQILRSCGIAKEQTSTFQGKCGEQLGMVLNPAKLIDDRRFEVKAGDATISLSLEPSYLIEIRIIDGKRCLLLPVGEYVEVNRLPVKLRHEKHPLSVRHRR